MEEKDLKLTKRIVDTTVLTGIETTSVQATKKRDKACLEEKESAEPRITSSPTELRQERKIKPQDH